MSAEGEEVGVDAVDRDAEHVAEQFAESLLCNGFRRPDCVRQSTLRLGQRLAVQLAAGRQRIGRQFDERRRHHVNRQRCERVLPQRVGVRRRGAIRSGR